MDPIIAAIAANNALIALTILAALIGFLGLLYFYLVLTGHVTWSYGSDDDDDDEDDVFIDTATVTQTAGWKGEQIAESEETLWSTLSMIMIIRRSAAKLNQSFEVIPVPQPDGTNNEVHFHVKDGTGVTTLLTVVSGSEEFLADLNRLMAKYPD